MNFDIFEAYPEEAELFKPLVGKTMLELGNKETKRNKNPNDRQIWKEFFEELGFEHTSVDLNGKDGALKLDLTKPLNLGTFDMVTNIGTTEHVAKQEPCWRNICEAMHVGSVFVSTTPKPGHWIGHGIFYPTAEFYENLARLNGMVVEKLHENSDHYANLADRLIFARLRKVEDAPFQMPDEGLLLPR